MNSGACQKGMESETSDRALTKPWRNANTFVFALNSAASTPSRLRFFSIRRLWFVLGFLSLLLTALGAEDVSRKPVYGPVKPMSPEELERTMAGQQKYEFDLAPLDGLVDASGAVIRADALPGYLRDHALSADAYFVLWVTADSPALNTLAPTIKPLGDYGITKIVVRARPGVTPKSSTTTDAVPKKTLVLQGKPNPGAIDMTAPVPALDGRPLELRPESLPPRVRYKFAPDPEVIAAAQILSTNLLTVAPDAMPIFSGSAIVQPGAWKALHNEGVSGFQEAKIMTALIPIAGRQARLEGAHLQNQTDLNALEDGFRKMIQADGGGRVRALRSAEMAKWWTFIGFDIEEPALVLETTRGKYRFIFGFSKGRALLVDELNSLPEKF